MTPCLDVGAAACTDPRRGYALPSDPAREDPFSLIVGYGTWAPVLYGAIGHEYRHNTSVWAWFASDRLPISSWGPKPVGSRC